MAGPRPWTGHGRYFSCIQKPLCPPSGPKIQDKCAMAGPGPSRHGRPCRPKALDRPWPVFVLHFKATISPKWSENPRQVWTAMAGPGPRRHGRPCRPSRPWPAQRLGLAMAGTCLGFKVHYVPRVVRKDKCGRPRPVKRLAAMAGLAGLASHGRPKALDRPWPVLVLDLKATMSPK